MDGSPIDWREYDDYFLRYDGPNRPLGDAERRAIAEALEDTLRLGSEDPTRGWGVASPPGAIADTVVRVDPEARIGRDDLRAMASRYGVGTIAVKVLKGTSRSRRASRVVIPFQRNRARSGHPVQDDPHVQRSLGAELIRHPTLGERGLVFLEWVEGRTLDHLRQVDWVKSPLRGDRARAIILDMLEGIALRLWREATASTGVVWDWRDAQVVVADDLFASTEARPPAGRAWCRLIDSDCLRYLTVATEKRDRQEAAAIRRIRNMIARILKGRGLRRGLGRVLRIVGAAWDHADLGTSPREGPCRGVLPTLGRTVGPGPEELAEARAGVRAFVSGLEQGGLFP